MSPDFIPRSDKSCHAKIGPSQNWSHQARRQGGFRVARKPHTRRGSPLDAREPPNRQHVKYAHALVPRDLELFGYNTKKKQLKKH